jgi:hypothetical protein
MAEHAAALVPLATGYFQSPELFAKGRKADIGLFAESLIYYDTVYVHFDNPHQFADFISLLIQQGPSYEALNELLEEGILRFLNTVTVHPFMGYGLGPRTIVSSFQSFQPAGMAEPGYFSKRFLEFEGLRDSFSGLGGLSTFDKTNFDKFCELAEKNSVVFSADDFGEDFIDNAYEDYLNPERNKLIFKEFLNEMFSVLRLGKVPNFDVRIREMNGDNYDEIAHNMRSAVIGRNLSNGGYTAYEVDYSIEVANLKSLESDKPIITVHTLPLSCAGMSNLYIKSAGNLRCDLFLPHPVSKVIGDKLYEINALDISSNNLKGKNIIEKLETQVEFPKLRHLANLGEVDFNKVLEIRSKAKGVRECLQSNTDKDIAAFIAYHAEVAKQSGFTSIGKKSLKLFGVLTSLAWSIFMEIQFKDDLVTKESAKTFGGKAIESLFDYGAKKLGYDWKPICFGDWYKEEIARLLERQRKSR